MLPALTLRDNPAGQAEQGFPLLVPVLLSAVVAVEAAGRTLLRVREELLLLEEELEPEPDNQTALQVRQTRAAAAVAVVGTFPTTAALAVPVVSLSVTRWLREVINA